MYIIRVVLMVIVGMFAATSQVYADYFSDREAAPYYTPPASSVASTSKKEVTLATCNQNHGSIVDQVQDYSPSVRSSFDTYALSPMLVQPLSRHSMQQSKCFTFSNSKASRWVLKVEVTELIKGEESAGVKAGHDAVTFIAGAFFATEVDPLKPFLGEVRVTLALEDRTTGALVSMVEGIGKKGDGNGEALMKTASGALATEKAKTESTYVLAAAFADAISKLALEVDKIDKPEASVGK